MKERVNSILKIIDEWTDLWKNRHFILFEIEGNFILSEIILDWKEMPKL